MTIRKLLLIFFIGISILIISINTGVLTFLTNRYFTDYLDKNYQTHLNQIIKYTEKVIDNKNTSFKQMAVELETHLNDPIIGIKLYSNNGDLLVDVSSNYHMNRINGKMMNHMMSFRNENEVESYKIVNQGKVQGTLSITKYSSLENSIISKMFKKTLIINSLFSLIIALIMAVFVGSFLSKKISKSIEETETLANDIQMGLKISTKKTFISEISRLQQRLYELNTRLKIKQKSRKNLIDQLMHQTGTPLTILRTHIEGIEDGFIELNERELSVWKNQVENLDAIISNIGGMIDANKEENKISIEEFEISELINQIVIGLKPQFDKKNIELKLLSKNKIYMKSDQYKLSQSIYNLLTNSYKYTPSNGSVYIDYKEENDKLILSIKDTGLGISDFDKEKIFDAYYRSNNTLQIKGEGIGLFVVKENITLLQGKIVVESELDKGSNFTIEIPLILKEQIKI